MLETSSVVEELEGSQIEDSVEKGKQKLHWCITRNKEQQTQMQIFF